MIMVIVCADVCIFLFLILQSIFFFVIFLLLHKEEKEKTTFFKFTFLRLLFSNADLKEKLNKITQNNEIQNKKIKAING